MLPFRTMETPKITAYLKTTCGWSAGVRAVLAKYNLQYTEKDIIQNPAFRWEMETKSGQPLSPCVEINDKMLADISGEEVEEYLIQNQLVQPSGADAGVAALLADAACRGAVYNVRINVAALEDRSRGAGLIQEANQLLAQTRKSVDEATAAVDKAIG